MRKSEKLGRETWQMIAKNLIFLVALAVIVFLAVMAWFTNNTKAEANGLSVAAKADSVEVSWDNINFYKNLTAQSSEQVVAGSVGLAKFYETGDPTTNTPSPIKLITGDGQTFYSPVLNRRTGTPLYQGNNPEQNWSVTQISDSYPNGDYLEVPLYFRSTMPLDVYLSSDSLVTPKDIFERKGTMQNPYDRPSPYGNFTRDWIAATSRVAFLNSEQSYSNNQVVYSNNLTTNFIWAPNSNVQLQESNDGFVRVTTTATDVVPEESGHAGYWNNVEMSNQNDSQYKIYFPESYYTTTKSQESESKGDFTSYNMSYQTYVDGKGLYVCTVPFTFTNDSPTNIHVPYFIHIGSGSLTESEYLGNIDYDKTINAIRQDSSEGNPRVEVSDQKFTLSDKNGVQNRKTCSIFFGDSNGTFKNSTVSVTLGYSPDSKQLIVIGYDCNNPNRHYTRVGNSTQTIETTYYNIPTNTNAVLANPMTAYALTTTNSPKYSTTVRFSDSSKNKIESASVKMTEQFTLILAEGSGAAAKYKIRSGATGSYLVVENAAISFGSQNDASLFSFEYLSGVTGPAIKYVDTYLSVSGSSIRMASAEGLNTNTLLTVYTGNSYNLIDTAAAETYHFYGLDPDPDIIEVDYNDVRLRMLNSSTAPNLFATPTFGKTGNTTATNVGNKKLLTLAKATGNATYYTGKIVMRIWAEGTDREAKAPLAEGIFNTSLHFVGRTTS